MIKLRIRKKDKVMVIAGRDRGKTGEVLRVEPDGLRVLVSKVNLVTRHKKRTQNDPGGLQKIEAPIHYSNVMLVCPKCDRPVRTRRGALGDGTPARLCRRCGEAIL